MNRFETPCTIDEVLGKVPVGGGSSSSSTNTHTPRSFIWLINGVPKPTRCACVCLLHSERSPRFDAVCTASEGGCEYNNNTYIHRCVPENTEWSVRFLGRFSIFFFIRSFWAQRFHDDGFFRFPPSLVRPAKLSCSRLYEYYTRDVEMWLYTRSKNDATLKKTSQTARNARVYYTNILIRVYKPRV